MRFKMSMLSVGNAADASAFADSLVRSPWDTCKTISSRLATCAPLSAVDEMSVGGATGSTGLETGGKGYVGSTATSAGSLTGFVAGPVA